METWLAAVDEESVGYRLTLLTPPGPGKSTQVHSGSEQVHYRAEGSRVPDYRSETPDMWSARRELTVSDALLFALCTGNLFILAASCFMNSTSLLLEMC